MKVDQIKLKTEAGAKYEVLTAKVARYNDVIVLSSAHFRNTEGEW